MRIAICAIKDIASDEALSYDYQFETNEEDVFKCYCKTAKCRGTMAPKKKNINTDFVTMNGRIRKQVIEDFRKKSKKSREESVQDEWSRSCTGKKLPGDSNHEVHSPHVINHLYNFSNIYIYIILFCIYLTLFFFVILLFV